MADYLIDDSTLFELGEAVRSICGYEPSVMLSPSAMYTDLTSANTEFIDNLDEQDTLLKSIQAALQGKATGGSASGSSMELLSILARSISGSYHNDSITHLGQFAFAGCSSLTSISFPKCAEISSNAFLNCSNLSIASICAGGVYDYAFSGCTDLKEFRMETSDGYIPAMEFLIASSAFDGCYALSTLILNVPEFVALQFEANVACFVPQDLLSTYEQNCSESINFYSLDEYETYAATLATEETLEEITE